MRLSATRLTVLSSPFERRRGGVPVSNTVDLFIVTGQSNAVGSGTAAESPAAPYGLWINGSNQPVQLVDPQGSVSTGSSWPAFSNEWHALTGRRAAFVYCGAGGSSLVQPNTGWSPTGSLRAQAVSAANQAISTLTASQDYPLGRVYFLWLQGETEGATINGTTITGATYEQALENLVDYFKSQVPLMETMGVIHISGPAGPAGAGATLQTAAHLGYQEIRAAQTRAVNDSSNLTGIYDGSYHFVGRGLSKDGTHYSQAGYNLIGKMAARGLNGSLGNLPSVSNPFISSQSYPRSAWGWDSARSASHTTPAGTNFIIVAVAHGWANSPIIAVPTVKFDGVTMRRAVYSGAANWDVPGSSYASIHYIDEEMYGASLAGLTKTIEVSVSNGQHNIAWSVINARDVVLCDSESGSSPVAGNPGATTISASITTLSSSTLLVSVASGITNNNGAPSSIWSGVNEIMDASLTDGSYSTSASVGYSQQTSRLIGQSVGVTWSGNVTHRALAVAAFRPKYQGEYP